MPIEVLAMILERVGSASLAQLMQCRVNRHWLAVIAGPCLRLLAAWNVPATIKPRAIKHKTVFSLVRREFRARCSQCRKQRKGLMPYGVQDRFVPKCANCRLAELVEIWIRRDEAALQRLPKRRLLNFEDFFDTNNRGTYVIGPTLVDLGLSRRSVRTIPTQSIHSQFEGSVSERRVIWMRLAELAVYAYMGLDAPIDQRQWEQAHGRRMK
ncbi:hypothetical protein GGF32_007496 [Allomyces javanicus]|nr:hypothetical protein GGF32_007496 [Allomyces javanicus]